MCFDIGGVLVQMPRGVLATELAALLGADVEHIRAVLIEHGKCRRTPVTRLAHILATTCATPEVTDDVAAVLRARLADMANPPLYPDALPTLAAVADAGFRICLLSNAIGPDPDSTGHAWGQVEHVERVLHSWQIGACKPSRVAFRAVESAMRLDPGELVMVGDSARFDIDGALAAGWSAIHLVRDPAAPSHPDVPRIGALSDVIPLLTGEEVRLS
ncbi:HAD family hydrolase [Nocardia otitidiscaviarum]|uniref:HAD family hydrolase n=1 Tax=Nocardia otitidiscaviarum TaxID=1823 RepID=UPI0020D01271|nr:HAD family hydrolase [Nocardia otitidiscaviarum]